MDVCFQCDFERRALWSIKTLWIGFVVGIKGIGSCQHGNASIDLDQEANIKNRMKTRSASRRQYARYPRRYELSNLKH